MPYKSQAQRRKFHAMLAKGQIDAATVAEWDRKSKGKKLLERAKKKGKDTKKKGASKGGRRDK